MNKVKILATGASVYALENISDDSMLFSWLVALRRRTNISVTLMCRHIPNYLHDYPIDNYIHNLDFPSKEQSLGKRFHGLNAGDSDNNLKKIMLELQDTDLLIIGGDPFIEITLESHRGILSYTELLVTLAKFCSVPVLLHGIHFGRPPKSDLAVEKMNFILDNVTAVSTRSMSALDKLREVRPNSHRYDFLHTDDAYGFDYSSPQAIFEDKFSNFLKWIEDVKSKGERVALITIRTLYWCWNDRDREKFLKEISEFLNTIHRQDNINFVFFPHCTYNKDHYWEDDRAGHNKLIDMLDHGSSYEIANRVEIGSIRHIFDAVDFAIGNRRHTGIFSCLSEKPFILFGERLHVAPVYSDLGFDECELFIDYEDLTSTKMLSVYNKVMSIPYFTRTASANHKILLEKFALGFTNILNLLIKA